MITRYAADERGRTRMSWLDSRHAFSFGHWRDPERMGFRVLRVLNDDRVVPGAGFGTHPHRDAEIISYVLDGAMEHRDSMGHGSVIRAGEVQRMTAGRGVTHSEFNASETEGLRFLQIWFLPEVRGLEPEYEQEAFDLDEAPGRLVRVVDGRRRDGAVGIHQDVSILAGRLGPEDAVEHALEPGRHAWVQVARGQVRLGDVLLGEGDGVAISDEPVVGLRGAAPAAEVLVIDLP